MFFVNNTMSTAILVTVYRDVHIDDDMSRLFSPENADYARQYAECAEDTPGVDFVKLQTLEVV